jgi:hypothetical protein
MEGMLIGIIVPVISLLTIGFIFYVFFTTRSKVRMMQVEKGTDSSLFKTKNTLKINYLIPLGVFLISIGIGVFLGSFLSGLNVSEGVAYNGSILIMGGVGLLAGNYLQKKSE